MMTSSPKNSMLPKVSVGRYCCAESTNIDNYRPLVGASLVDDIHALARSLKGLRVCHVNATAAGGGVAELLGREIPIYNALGIRADWRTIHGNNDFFTITKGFHNAIQGAQFQMTQEIRDEYLHHNRLSAETLEDNYDIYIVHDPQPAALRHFAKKSAAKWIWRCHIDSGQPNPDVWHFLQPYVESHDAAVFTMEAFRPEGLAMPQVYYIPPAIDPLATKNMDLPLDLCRRAIGNMGVNLKEPILLQVSRFDPWKDPLGVIRAYNMVKQSRPKAQLVLVGAMASDDPEGWGILDTINQFARKDPGIFVFTNMTGVGNMEVNAFQRGADLIIQKSLKEGFGLVVSEAFWKGKPLVAGRAGGIPMQFPKGYDKFLVNSVEECADRLLHLLDHPNEAEQFGKEGMEKVRQEFLMPRLIRDELRLMKDVLTH